MAERSPFRSHRKVERVPPLGRYPTHFRSTRHETATELANWNDYLDLSTWQLWNDVDPFDSTKFAKTTAYEQTWLYDKFVPFANDYGTTHPYEDFATAFESYFAQLEGRVFIGGGVEAVPDKWAFLDALFNTLL